MFATPTFHFNRVKFKPGKSNVACDETITPIRPGQGAARMTALPSAKTAPLDFDGRPGHENRIVGLPVPTYRGRHAFLKATPEFALVLDFTSREGACDG